MVLAAALNRNINFLLQKFSALDGNKNVHPHIIIYLGIHVAVSFWFKRMSFSWCSVFFCHKKIPAPAFVCDKHLDVWKFVLPLLSDFFANIILPYKLSMFWYSRGGRPLNALLAITPPTLPSLTTPFAAPSKIWNIHKFLISICTNLRWSPLTDICGLLGEQHLKFGLMLFCFRFFFRYQRALLVICWGWQEQAGKEM